MNDGPPYYLPGSPHRHIGLQLARVLDSGQVEVSWPRMAYCLLIQNQAQTPFWKLVPWLMRLCEAPAWYYVLIICG